MKDLLSMVFKKGKKQFSRHRKEKTQKQKEADKEVCPICQVDFEDKDEVIQLRWSENHIFHELCIKDWLMLKQDCPLWRKEVFEMGYSESSFSQYREAHKSQNSANKSRKSRKSLEEKENSKKEESVKAKSSKNSIKKDKNDLELVKELLKENQMLK